MTSLFALYHDPDESKLESGDVAKLLGVFSTRAGVELARGEMLKVLGLKSDTEEIIFDEIELNETQYSSGFVTLPYESPLD